jgi:hypothetical protein
MVVTGCVMAQLDLLQRAATLFQWTADVAKIDRLLVAAKQMNAAAANPPDGSNG